MTVAAPVAGRVQPSGWWYALPAVGLLVAGIFGIQVVRGGGEAARDVVIDANLAILGEEQAITIEEPGGYTIGYVGAAPLSDGERDRLAQELVVEVRPFAGGAPLALERYEEFQQMSPSEDGAWYVPLLTVRFPEEGDYVLESDVPASLDPRSAALVLTQSPYRKIADALRIAATLMVVAVFLAVLGTVILARTRGRSRRALRAALPPVPPGGHPWGTPVGGWPPP